MRDGMTEMWPVGVRDGGRDGCFAAPRPPRITKLAGDHLVRLSTDSFVIRRGIRYPAAGALPNCECTTQLRFCDPALGSGKPGDRAQRVAPFAGSDHRN